MAACTPTARDMSQGRNDAHNAPDDPFDLKAYDLLDDIHNAVSPSTHKALILRIVQNKMSSSSLHPGSEACYVLQVNDYTAHGMDAFEE